MKTLDLHGNDHASVAALVEEFVHSTELPAKIITGKSEKMRKIVLDTIRPLGYYSHYEQMTNEGCLVITEQKF
tara:strand:+ start:11215 stop:11433 length:219 start_codon:yes stop_codon:yes gene_type:complete